MSATAALVVAAALAGCGSTTYFAGRTLPPSGIANRVLIAVQNPSSVSKGILTFVDAYYDIRYSYNDKTSSFSIAGYSGAQPITIQNMPEEQLGAVYSSGDGNLALVNYAKETSTGAVSGLPGPSASIFITRDQSYTFAASESSRVFTIVDKVTPGNYGMNLPGVYRTSVNPGGTAALAFVQNSNYVYYPVKLNTAEITKASAGPSSWPKAAVDCEPQPIPAWCMFQAQSPDGVDPIYNGSGGLPTLYTGAPLTFDRPTKAVFSSDGATAYILNCGPECGGNAASISVLPVGPMLFNFGQSSGQFPKANAIPTVPIPGGASNALVAGSTMYVAGQCPAAPAQAGQTPQCVAGSAAPNALYAGMLTVLNLNNLTVAAGPISISDGTPGGPSRMALADDNTLWIGMTKCNMGARAANGLAQGCLTMFNTGSNTVTMLEPYLGDATGIAAVTGLHKIYTAVGGQVYIYKTTDGSTIDNQYVTVTGTAYDVAYMDAVTDGDNTVY